MRKKFLPVLILLLSFILCFSYCDLSYAISSPPTTYTVTTTANVFSGGASSTKKVGSIAKGQKVKIIALEKNSTGTWWVKISQSTNNGKWVSTYKNKWIHSGYIDFPYQAISKDNSYYAIYSVTTDYPSMKVRSSYSTSSTKVGTLPKNRKVKFSQIVTTSSGQIWGKIYQTTDSKGKWVSTFKNKWVCIKSGKNVYMNFTGSLYTFTTSPIRNGMYETAKKVGTVSKGKCLEIKRIELNSKGNWWCKINSGTYKGKWIYFDNLTL